MNIEQGDVPQSSISNIDSKYTQAKVQKLRERISRMLYETFILLGIPALGEHIKRIDEHLIERVQSKWRTPFLDILMPRLSALGDFGAIWLMFVSILIFQRTYRELGIVMFYSLGSCTIIGNFLFKPLFGRIRPCNRNKEVELLIERPKDGSFPSGHSMASFCSATFLLQVHWLWGLAAITLASGISFSRVYLYVHYLSDILMGLVMGVLVAIAFMWIMNHYVGFVPIPLFTA